jgi:cell wall-associated NlpC family hydrolase
MRTIGDSSWLNDYIGIPYKFGGREMDGCDCYGLAKLVYKNEYGIHLPDWHLDQIDLRGRDKVIEEVVTSGRFEATEDPEDGDFVVCYRTRAAYHIGLYFSRGVLHAAEGIGAIYTPVSRFERDYVRVVYGVWEQ